MNIFTRAIYALNQRFNKALGSTGGTWVSLFGGNKLINQEAYYSGIVYKCIDIIASNVSTNKYGLYQKDNDENKEIYKHPALELLKRPNNYQTTSDLLYQISSQIDVAGVSYLYPVKSMAGNTYKELWTLNPNKVRVIPGTDEPVSHYEYRKPKGGVTKFQLDELIEIKRPDPFDMLSGLSTITKAKYEIEGMLNAVIWNSKFFEKGAMPSGVLTTDQKIDDQAFDRLDKEWRKKYEGSDNAHKVLILDGGLKWEQVTLKQKDMDFIKQREFSRDEILAIFGVPKGILYANDVNRANAEAAKYFFAEHTLSPRLDLIFEKLNAFFLPLFDKAGNLEFVPDNPVPENVEQELMRKEKSVNRWLTVNEVRAEDGYEPLEGGDILYLPTNLMPSGEDQNPPTKAIAMKKRVTTTDDKYLRTRRRYTAKKEKEMKSKISAHYSFLLKNIQKHKPKTKTIRKEQSVGEVFSRIMPNMTEWTNLTATITFQFGREVFEEAIKQTSSKYDMPIDFDLEHTGALSLLNKRSNDTATSMTDTIISDARQIIAEELEKGNVSLVKIKDRIYAELNYDKEWKAERVARTEVNKAYSDGSMMMYKQNSLVKQIKWLAENDACTICSPNNNEIIAKNGVFTSGHSNTPAHPNCRCEVIPYFD